MADQTTEGYTSHMDNKPTQASVDQSDNMPSTDTDISISYPPATFGRLLKGIKEGWIRPPEKPGEGAPPHNPPYRPASSVIEAIRQARGT